jgi:multiple sugar transport system substrate-binding protein
MFKMKRLLFLTGLSIILLATGPSGLAGNKIEITAATTIGINEEVARNLTDKFNAENPDIHVKLDAVPWSSIFDKMMVEFATGRSSYDVVWNSMSMLPTLVRSNYLEPLDRYLNNAKLINKKQFDLKDFSKSLMPTVQGHLYHLPYMTGPHLLYYRKDLLEQANLKVPKTLAEFMTAVKKLHNPGKGIYGTVIHGIKSGAGGNTYQYYDFLNSFGGQIIDSKGKVAISSKKAIEALDFWLEMYRYSPPDSINYGAGAASEAMMAGKVALMITYSDHYARFLDPKRSKIVDKIGWALLPAGPAGSHPIASTWNVSISKFSREKAAAFKYLTYLLKKENMGAYLDAGGVPPRTSALSGPSAKGVTALELTATALNSSIGVPFVSEYMKIEEILATSLNQALANQMTSKQALEDAAKQISQVLKKK